MQLLPEDQWTAERCGSDHVVVSVRQHAGYRDFVRLTLVDAADNHSGGDDLKSRLVDEVELPAVR